MIVAAVAGDAVAWAAFVSGDELRWNMVLGLNSVSNLSTVVGLAIHEDFLARAAGAAAIVAVAAGAAVVAAVESLIELLEAAAERATPATESLVNVISLSPNTAMGQLLVISGASKPSEEAEGGEVPLLLPVLVLLLGELLHELDEVLGGDNFCASFVLFSCALSLSALAVGEVAVAAAAVEVAVAAATGTAAAAAAAGSTIITLLMGIAVVVVAVAVAVAMLVVSAS